MSSLSTHVLDATSGMPAADITVSLTSHSEGAWTDVASAVTDTDGRVRDLAPGGLPAGMHRLTFLTGPYFAAAGIAGFYPEVAVTFTVDEERQYHVPLLLSPFAYSTYRGS